MLDVIIGLKNLFLLSRGRAMYEPGATLPQTTDWRGASAQSLDSRHAG